MFSSPAARTAVFALAIFSLSGIYGSAQNVLPSASQPTIRFELDFPAHKPAHYLILLSANGSGYYVATSDNAAEGRRNFTLPAGSAAALFADAQAVHYFRDRIASRGKVAFQGNKTLGYSGPEGVLETQYNWSSDKHVQHLTSTFQGIAFTVQLTDSIEHDLKYDPLSLDQDTRALETSLRNGEAVAGEIAAPTLQQIVANPNVLEIARRRAQLLLASLNEPAVQN